MGGIYCAVYGCLNSQKQNPELSFFQVPKDKERRMTWLKLIGREDIESQYPRVCSKHFEQNTIVVKAMAVKPDAIPTLHLPLSDDHLSSSTSSVYSRTRYTSDSHGSGDGGPGCCRLCGGREKLQAFCGNERYDRLVYHCFNVVVTPIDSLICERCVSQLRTADRFKALVDAAFEKTTSDSDCESVSTRTCIARKEPETLMIKSPTDMKTESRLLIISPKPKQKKIVKDRRITKFTKITPIVKKMNIACSICKQRYPMMVPVPGQMDFVCARCKNSRNANSAALKKCNLPPAVTLDRVGDQGDGRRHRLSTGTTLKPKLRKCESVLKYHCEPRKYQCSQCTQHFILPQRLAEHIKSVHNDSLDSLCIVCGRNLKTRSNLEKHLKSHTGELYQCDVCEKIFKSKPTLQTHLFTHKKKQCYNEKYASGEKNNWHRL